MAEFGVTRGKSIPIMVDLKLHMFDKNESDVDVPFRSLARHLMWIANQTVILLTRVTTVSSYSAAPKFIASAGSVAHRDVPHVHECVRNYVPVGSERMFSWRYTWMQIVRTTPIAAGLSLVEL